MKETIRKRLEEKGHTDPDRALEGLGITIEQKGHPRFDETGFMWYGTFITDPNKDETGRFTVDPKVYYSRHYEDWLKWKVNRSSNSVQAYDAKIEQKQTATIFYDPEFKLALHNLETAWMNWLSGPATEELTPMEVDKVVEEVIKEVKSLVRF
jgi:hypothetical protein